MYLFLSKIYFAIFYKIVCSFKVKNLHYPHQVKLELQEEKDFLS